MDEELSRRAVVKTIFWRPIVGWVAAGWGAYGITAVIDDQISRFPSWFQSAWKAVYVLPDMSLRAWIDIALMIIAVAAVEGAYRFVKRDWSRLQELEEVFKRRTEHQELADKLSDQHDHGIHQLLNKPPKTSDDVDGWLAADHDWTEETLRIMRNHGCTKQDLFHVRNIGLFPVIGLHPNELMDRRLSMLAVRLDRIGDMISKYAAK